MKKVLFVLIGLVVLLIAVAGVLTLVMPTDFAVEREVVINKPKAEVFDYIKHIKNQEKWSSWAKKDPNSKYTYTGTDGEVGFISAWESDNPDVGSGEQEIKKIVDGERIDVEMRFKVPFESTSEGYMVTEASGDDKTKIKWGFSGAMPRPWNLMMLFMDMEQEVGKDFDTGLANLKTLMESQPTVVREPTETKPTQSDTKGDKATDDKSAASNGL